MTKPTQHGKPQAGAAAPGPATGSQRGPGSPRPQNCAAGKASGGLGAVARQFAGLSGPADHLVTWLLARGNARLNNWLVHEVAAAVPAAGRLHPPRDPHLRPSGPSDGAACSQRARAAAGGRRQCRPSAERLTEWGFLPARSCPGPPT